MVQKLMILGLFSLLTLIPALAYAETLNLQIDKEYLAGWNTSKSNFTFADGSVDVFTIFTFQHHYPNMTVALANPEPIKADPIGFLYELIIEDRAGIFQDQPDFEPIIEEAAPINVTEIVDEPEDELTEEQIAARELLLEKCQGGVGYLGAFQASYHFFIDHDLSWYLGHLDEVDKKVAECRALETMKKIYGIDRSVVIEEPGLPIETVGPSRISPSLTLDSPQAVKAREDAQKMIDESTYLNFPEKIPDPVISTIHNAPTDEQVALREHTQRENANIKAWQAACGIYWNDSGKGQVALSFWNDHLLNGDCDTFTLNATTAELIDLKSYREAKQAEESR